MQRGSILVVDDDEDVLQTARMFLKQHFGTIDLMSDPQHLLSQISRVKYDAILLDMNFRKGINDGEAGFYWLERILEFDPHASVILITAYGEIDLAVQAMKKGAVDFVLKPWKNQKLLATVTSAINLSLSKQENSILQAKYQDSKKESALKSDHFIGSAPAIMDIKNKALKVAPTDASVLILGENGTGKEILAQFIHQNSKRSDHDFIKVDLGALPASLFESELFGHQRGAFTDAKEDRIGRFEWADKGTLFLDEIGNISLEQQVKLLSVLQDQKIRRIGSERVKDIDVRVISATNSNIVGNVESGEFREDLLYRLNTLVLELPPLRDRKEDILPLANHFLKLYTSKYQKNLRFSSKAMDTLKMWHWPGNIRELQHCLERAVILSEHEEIADDDILIKRSSESESVDELETLDDVEKWFIEKTLRKNEGNVTKTAEDLGLTRMALYRRFKKFKINY